MGALDKQVTITFNLRKAVSMLVVVALLFGVFYVGRCTAPKAEVGGEVAESQSGDGFFAKFFSSKSGDTGSNSAATATVTSPEEKSAETEEAQEVIEEEESTTQEVSETETIEEVEEIVEEESVEAEETPEVVEEVDEGPETFITTGYENVGLELTSVQHEWYETWGKIQRINFKITNNEEGTITATEAYASFEGYPEEGDVIQASLPTIHQQVKQGKEQTSNIQLDFAYAEAQTEPENLKISLTLYDEDGEKIVQSSKEFDLTKTVVE